MGVYHRDEVVKRQKENEKTKSYINNLELKIGCCFCASTKEKKRYNDFKPL